MKKVIPLIIGLAFLFVPVAAVADDADSEVVHVVKKGDTLWDISKKYLQTPWQWPLVWAENDKITNPHLIYPGDKVIIFSKDGKVMIKVVPVDKTSGESIYTIDQLNDIQGKSIVLSPEYSTLIFSAKPLKSQGKVAAKVDVGDLSSELDRILVKGLPNIKPGTGVVIKTLLTEVKTDDSTIGYMYKINGLANVESVDNGIATCRVIYNYQEINKDDIVDDTMKGIAPLVIKPAVNNNIAMTSILDVWNNCAGGGNGDVIFIASGSKKGVKQGDIINLYKPVAVKDGKKPKTIYEPIGNAIVLQAVENSSMALITYSLMYIEEGFSASGK